MTTEEMPNYCYEYMQMHHAEGCFVMPNTWVGGSVKLI